MKIEGYENYIITRSGEVINTNTNHKLKNQVNNSGYYRVELSRSGNKKKYFLHRLLADAYIENPDNLPQINHKNGDKLDNNLSNLEWCTSSHNHKHSFKYLNRKATKLFNENNGKTKIRLTDIPALRKRKETETYRSIAKDINVHPKYLSRVLKGELRGQ